MFSFLVAVQFLTTLPIRVWREIQGEDIARSVRYFPLVGVLLGVLTTLLYRLLAGWLPPQIIPLVLVTTFLMVTGALHYDGFLDSCDGLFGYRSPERRLEIMRDSRVGSFAVAGGWVLLSFKYAGLSLVPPDLMPAALMMGAMLGRWALVVTVVIFPYGRETGLGKIYKQYNTRNELLLAAVGVSLLAALILHGPGLLGVGLASGLAWLIGRWIMTRLPAGLTGDSYGAIAELTEMASWLLIGVAPDLIKLWM